MKKKILEKVKKREQKVFTKKKGSDIITKDYNPFEVNCKIYERRSWLHMKNTKFSEKKEFINLLLKICSDLGIKNGKKEVENFIARNQIDI